MKRAIVYAVAALLLVGGVFIAVRPVRQRARELAQNFKLIRGDTGDVMASATYQRFAVRRRAVESMRASLRGVATAESLFMADSGRPMTSQFSGRYAFANDPANLVSIEIRRDRWVAQARNTHTSMSCSLTAMLVDSMAETWRYHAGEPVCAEWTAESIAVATAPAPQQPATIAVDRRDEADGQPAQPHWYGDWGPVNNTPPPTPYIVRDACQGEGCDRSGSWAACSTLVAHSEKRRDAAPVFTIKPGEPFTAITSDIHVEVPGMLVFRDTTSQPIDERGMPGGYIRFTPADTVYLLNYIGEGYLVWWYRGRAVTGYQFWVDDRMSGRLLTRSAVAVRSQKAVWWVRVRSTAGQDGWIIGDGDRLATDGSFDDVGRCLHPAKG